MIRLLVILLLTMPLPSDHPASAPAPGSAAWRWPLRPPPRVVRGFDPPTPPWRPGHRGVDLAARPGRPVYAAGPGRIGFARDLAGRGVITVVHGALRTTYLPVHPVVPAGRVVSAGARIGMVEDLPGHCGPSSCLHWGLRHGDVYLDPLALPGLVPVRLLPWWRRPAGPPTSPGRHDRPSAPRPPYGRGTAASHASPRRTPPVPATGKADPALRLTSAATAVGSAAGCLVGLGALRWRRGRVARGTRQTRTAREPRKARASPEA